MRTKSAAVKMNKQAGHLQAETGFTLIELLVVISLVSVLIAILLPALGSARKRAAEVQCASNTRQMHLMATTYTSDHQGFYPIVGEGGFDNTWVTTANGTNYFAWGGNLGSYIINFDVLMCPAADSRLRDFNYGENFYSTTYHLLAGNGRYPAAANVFYGRLIRSGSTKDNDWSAPIPNVEWAGRTLDGSGTPYDLYGEFHIYEPSEQAMFIEPHEPDKIWDAYSARLTPQSHDHGGNVIWVDGHGEWRNTDQSVNRWRHYQTNNQPHW